MASKIWYPNK